MDDKLSIVTLAVAKAYTKATADAMGALKGAPCEVKFTEAIPGGTKVTLGWESKSGQQESTFFYVMDGQDGKGIASVLVNAEGHLIITYTDGTTTDAGKIEVQSAVDSVNGKTGNVKLVLTDVVNVGDGLTYDPVTNTLSVSAQAVQQTVEDVLDEEIGGYIEEELPNNLASDSDIDNLFNN